MEADEQVTEHQINESSEEEDVIDEFLPPLNSEMRETIERIVQVQVGSHRRLKTVRSDFSPRSDHLYTSHRFCFSPFHQIFFLHHRAGCSPNRVVFNAI